jgi:hypothetical protein
MVEILNFKKGVAVIKLNAAVTSLNVWGILMFHCGRDKRTDNVPFHFSAGSCLVLILSS